MGNTFIENQERSLERKQEPMNGFQELLQESMKVPRNVLRNPETFLGTSTETQERSQELSNERKTQEHYLASFTAN